MPDVPTQELPVTVSQLFLILGKGAVNPVVFSASPHFEQMEWT